MKPTGEDGHGAISDGGRRLPKWIKDQGMTEQNYRGSRKPSECNRKPKPIVRQKRTGLGDRSLPEEPHYNTGRGKVERQGRNNLLHPNKTQNGTPRKIEDEEKKKSGKSFADCQGATAKEVARGERKLTATGGSLKRGRGNGRGS